LFGVFKKKQTNRWGSWRCGWKGKSAFLALWDHEFKPQFCKNKTKQKKRIDYFSRKIVFSGFMSLWNEGSHTDHQFREKEVCTPISVLTAGRLAWSSRQKFCTFSPLTLWALC
jgi:hypothetical protein